jgi:hypothetical protein
LTRTGNKARATTPSTKSPPNPYPGVPHYPPRTQIRAPHSDTQQTTTCTSGQAKEEKHRHTKATQGTEPNTPHLGGHTFAPPPDMSRLHTFTHQGSPTRLRPTRNNPTPPQGDAPQGDLQPDRQSQTANAIGNHPTTQTRNSTSPTNKHQTQPATSTQTTTPRESPPHTTGDTPQQDPEDRGTHSKQQDTQTPKAAHQHETTQPPHHMASPPPTPTTPPHNPNTARQSHHPNQPGSTQRRLTDQGAPHHKRPTTSPSHPASLPTLITIKIQRRRQIAHHRPVHRAKDSNPHSMPVTRPRTTSLTTTVHSNNIPVKHPTIPPAGNSDRSGVVHPLTLPHVRTKNTPITTPPATNTGIPGQPTPNNRIGAPHSRVTPTNVSRIKNHTPRRHTPNHTRRNPNSHSIRHTHHRALPRFIARPDWPSTGSTLHHQPPTTTPPKT